MDGLIICVSDMFNNGMKLIDGEKIEILLWKVLILACQNANTIVALALKLEISLLYGLLGVCSSPRLTSFASSLSLSLSRFFCPAGSVRDQRRKEEEEFVERMARRG